MDKEKEENKPDQKVEKSLIEDLLGDLINLDRGLPATFIGMIKSPALVIRSYFENEKRYVNPFRYTIFILAITTMITAFFIDYEGFMEAAMEMGSGSEQEFEMMIQDIEEQTGFDARGYFEALEEFSLAIITKFNQVLYIVVFAPILAMVSRIFFSSTFKEKYVMYLYAVGTYSVFSLLLIPLLVLQSSVWLFMLVATVSMLIYVMYVQGKFLKLSGFGKYFQSFLSFVLGYIVFAIVQAIIQYVGAFILFMSRS
ncbi:MAG: DUF3667 domain-containing protein [Balneolales bacterium]|nr:DUF3667 domain-containing protein [Balneolales bacterium]